MKHLFSNFYFTRLFSRTVEITVGGFVTDFKPNGFLMDCKVLDTRQLYKQVVPFIGIYRQLKPPYVDMIKVQVNGLDIIDVNSDALNDINALHGIVPRAD